MEGGAGAGEEEGAQVNLDSMFGVGGKRAVVTGGASGIGLGIATLLAQAGADVVIAGRRADVGAEAVAAVRAACDRGSARFVRTDVRSADSVRALFAEGDAGGGVDILVNAAGSANPRPLAEHSDDDIDTMLDVNLRGVLYCAREAVPRLAARGGGSIVNIASYLGYRGGPGWAPVYSAAKGGVIALTRSLAVQHGPQQVRVNAVCPGFVPTALVDDLLAQTTNPAAALRRMAMEYPLRRTGTPEDVARAVLFLVSPAASWITGVVLPVDGGVTAK